MFKFFSDCIESVKDSIAYATNMFVGSMDLVRTTTVEYYTATQDRSVRLGTAVAAGIMTISAPFVGPAMFVVATAVGTAYVIPKVVYEIAIWSLAVPVTITTMFREWARQRSKPTVATVFADAKEVVKEKTADVNDEIASMFKSAVKSADGIGAKLAAKAKAHAASKAKVRK